MDQRNEGIPPLTLNLSGSWFIFFERPMLLTVPPFQFLLDAQSPVSLLTSILQSKVDSDLFC